VVPINANATAIPPHTVGGLPNKHAWICANVFPTPTAGRPAPLPFPLETSVGKRVRYRCCRRVTHAHGGLTPAALFRRAFVHRKDRFFAGKRPRSNTRAGGVSPPWYLLTRMQRRFPHTPSAARRTSTLGSAQTSFPRPRRADQRRFRFRSRRASATVCGIGVAGAFPEQHGGRTSAALDRDAGHARRLRFPLPVRCSYQRPDLSLGLGSGQKRCGEKRPVNVSRFRVAHWISDKSGARRSGQVNVS
jgi:hypothetical protein